MSHQSIFPGPHHAHKRLLSGLFPALVLLATIVTLASPLTVIASQPDAWAGLEKEHFEFLDTNKLDADRPRSYLSLMGADTLAWSIESETVHANGDRTTVLRSGSDHFRAVITTGNNAHFGVLHGEDGLQLITTDRQGSWLVRIPGQGNFNHCEVGQHEKPAPKTKLKFDSTEPPKNLANDTSVIDLLVTYNRAMAERYPGDLIDTRINHMVFLANQAFANSGIDSTIRLVGNRMFDYRNDNSNNELLNDLANTLAGQSIAGLGGLRELRNTVGADLVVMFRPHDIFARGSCGVAFLPTGDPNIGVNVVSDGMSSWSICLDDVLTHEIGHNLGATHQLGAGGNGFDPRGSALVVPGRFSTIMASFGTGRADRFRSLPLFSTTQLSCGGQVCGGVDGVDNTAVMQDVVPIIASYSQSVSLAPLPDIPQRGLPDSDGDGFDDWSDNFPFDDSEWRDLDKDGVGDNADQFPDDLTESRDTDSDGVGDNLDPDNDGDGIADSQDAFPLDASESNDGDRDGVGLNSDAFPFDASEFLDTDSDGLGNNEDSDDDDDGVSEFDPVAEDLLVVSTGNNRILRFDSATGTPRGIEVPPSDGLLTFQSDLVWRPTDHTLLYTSSSSIRRLDLLDRSLLQTWVSPYFGEIGTLPQLGTGFPTGLTLLQDGEIVAVSRDSSASIVFFSGQELARTDNSRTWVIGSPAGPVDILSNNETTYILDASRRAVLEIAGTSRVETLNGPEADWMLDPRRMAFGSNNELLISDRGRNTVVAIDLDDGAFLGDRANLANIGYSGPDGLTVSSSGELLVSALDQNAILAFDAASGAFKDVRVTSGSGGLSAPAAVITVPALLDRLGSNPGRVLQPNGGIWFNPASDGRGFDIEVYDNRLSAVWYTYEESGLPIWYIASGTLNGFDFEGPLFRYQQNENGQTSFVETGRLRLEFHSERLADMSFTLGDITGGETLQWLAFDSNPATPNTTGLWSPVDLPGWGFTLATQGNSSVAIAYLYDDTGEPRWLISNPVANAEVLNLPMNASFAQGLCPGCTAAPGFELIPAGQMQIEFGDEPAWSSDAVFPAPMTGQWLLDRLTVQRISDPVPNPR